MTQAELLEIIANGENSGVEFKREDVTGEDLAKEVVAFANLRGGRVLIGVEDDKTISGISRDNLQAWVMDVITDKITPALIPYYEEVSAPFGRVAVVTVSTGTAKPYAAKRRNRADIYVRIGDTSRLASREQIIRLAQESGMLHPETLPVSGARFDQINLPLFFGYYQRHYDEDLLSAGAETIQEKLQQLDFIVPTEHQGLLVSIAGLVLFGNTPGRYLPQHGFRIIHYPGLEADLNVVSDQTITTHLANLKQAQNGLLIPGLLDSVMLHLQEKLSAETIMPDGLTRARQWRYPEEILRELVVNAIIHRDYTKANRNEILLFADRMEIVSYGALPNTLTVEKIKAGQKYPRNPNLIRAAQDFGFMEHRGLGIRRKVLPTLRQHGFPEPLFEATEDYFKVVIRKPSAA